MSNKTKITVTKDDIKRGCRSSFTNCPIARAIARTVPGAHEVCVFGTPRVHINYVAYHISRSARRFISNFDCGKPVKPFSFIMTELS